jgi:HEAT repeat protein
VQLGKSERRPFLASWAARVLARFGPAAVPELRALLKDPRNFVRWNAPAALMEIGPGARDAAGDLARLLQDHPYAQAAAAKALALIGEPAIPILLEQLRQEEGAHYFAAIALGEIGEPAVADLRKMLEDPVDRPRSRC